MSWRGPHTARPASHRLTAEMTSAATFGDRIAARPDSPRHHAAGITAELLVAYADQDGSMPPDQIARLEAALAKE